MCIGLNEYVFFWASFDEVVVQPLITTHWVLFEHCFPLRVNKRWPVRSIQRPEQNLALLSPNLCFFNSDKNRIFKSEKNKSRKKTRSWTFGLVVELVLQEEKKDVGGVSRNTGRDLNAKVRGRKVSFGKSFRFEVAGKIFFHPPNQRRPVKTLFDVAVKFWKTNDDRADDKFTS